MPTSSNTQLASKPQADPIKLNRLLQLCSANLPVGGFSFSQGLEYAVEMGWLTSPETAASWININLEESIAQTDLAILQRLYQALSNNNFDAFNTWNQHLIACRESHELLLADLAMGKALVRLLRQLNSIDSQAYEPILASTEISFVSAFAICAYLFELDLLSAQSGYCWTYIDNQVAAATKLIPLGQTQAQNLLFELTENTQLIIEKSNCIADDDVGTSLPHLAMASAWHETQYSRLFRS
ncbi:urease accessory protein UreF [Psychrosphaera saromensis]|uniref:Urease accessory protein UreF n=1 Tax=Psychrosphaera saromensis TaxID=716813 RepID=A0A2S7URZ0_9GAMM|nr:urease accessory UreF family protein [Psychrosphaera saromensis]PQJ52509.1 urease accessory protein UreF [Psychrosphaera saromensis]GHB69080.1 urease accessory protein UreF [Psychrosphaera saromensis]GLQ12973.1 urease accessory protein UreF [Psychrosphaera saromensis]